MIQTSFNLEAFKRESSRLRNYIPAGGTFEKQLSYGTMNTVIELLGYIRVLLQGHKWRSLRYLFVALVFARKRSYIKILKLGGRVIGGCILSDMPLIKKRFQGDAWTVMKKLRNQGFCYGGSLVIDSRYRNQGIGTFILNDYMENGELRFYSVPSPRAKDLYLRIGAQQVFDGSCIILTWESRKHRNL